MSDILCIYHGNCADGFTAAWAVYKRFGDAATFHAGVYGQSEPYVTGKHVIIVDFSYKREVLLKMAKAAKSLLVLDHHKSAFEDLGDFPKPIVPNNWDAHLSDCGGAVNDGTDPSLPRVVFDMDRSGAMIAWQYFFPNDLVPRLVEHVQDRDLWKFALPQTREIQACVFSHAYTFENWDMLASADIAALATEGAAIERKHHKDIAELLPVTKQRMVIGGYDVPVANLPYTMASDAAGQMAEGELFAACYYDTPDGRVFSLRSRGDFDVSAIAKQYGGGGHKNAAGFKKARYS